MEVHLKKAKAKDSKQMNRKGKVNKPMKGSLREKLMDNRMGFDYSEDYAGDDYYDDDYLDDEYDDDYDDDDDKNYGAFPIADRKKGRSIDLAIDRVMELPRNEGDKKISVVHLSNFMKG